MENNTLIFTVASICNRTYSQNQLVQFIDLTKKISLGYLRYQEVIGKRISGERNENREELGDLALDCVAELFSSDGCGNFPQLVKYYQPFLANPGITDEELLALTRRLVVRKTKQELSRIFRERDPEGAKIVRNIKVAIRSSEKLQTFREMGKEYVFYTNDFTIDKEQPIDPKEIAGFLRKESSPIPEDILHTRFIDIYNPGDSISSSINKLLKAIYSLEDYQNFLPLDAIVKLIRRVKFEVLREKLDAEDNVPTPLDHLENQEIESYVQVVMQQVNTKINKLYLKPGKISAHKAQIYHLALHDVLYDLLQKKDSSSYYRNLKYYLPQLTQMQYRKEERTVFEYLAKIAKKNFRGHLQELL
ncbi:MAG TPA: hypothetical protein PLP19_12490 [bacterium]|nr:hypothetical protein [bacterium]HPN44303.1 hypothetical protein [bacterium]